MNWQNSLLVSFLTGLLGLFLGGLVGIGCVKWFCISSFEGASGYAVVGVALCGSFLAFIVGLVAARWGADHEAGTFTGTLLRAWGTSIGIAILVAGICRLLAGPQDEPADNPPHTTTTTDVEKASFTPPSPDAPLQEWIALIQYGATEEQTALVVRAVESRSAFPAEAKAIIFGDDHRLAGSTMGIIASFEMPSSDLTPVIIEAGNELAGRFRTVNALKPEEDPSFQAAADLSLRFYGWIAAARALRAAGKGDFVPELSTLDELARVRTDSFVMKNDISRITNRYLGEWKTAAKP